MTRLSLTLLGDFQARLGPGPPLRLRARKTQALLAYLALPAGQAHSRDKLAALLWGEHSQHHARSRLRETLYVLRRTLTTADPPCLDAGNETVALNADAVDVDAVAFERLVETGGAVALGHAVDLYRGDLLAGLEFRGALFEDWLMAERERLRELALDALAKLLAYQRSAGLAEPALQTALRLIALDPLQEAVHRTLMRLYAQLGRRGSALRQYQACVSVLRRELGVEPEADTRKVYQEILRRRAGTGMPDGRQFPEGGSSPGILGAQPLAIPTDIPLIGREPEMARGRAALVEAHAGRGQIMLVLGEAGIGKTTLLGAFAADAVSNQARVLLGRCYESTQILPFGPWVDAVRAGDVLADEAVLGTLDPAWRAELTRLFPEIAAPGLPPSSDNALRLFESVARLLDHLAATQLLVLLLEDVHWADEMSLRLLAFTARRIPSRRVLLVVTSRDEELADAAAARRTIDEINREPHVTRSTLAPLTRRDTIDLIRSLARRGAEQNALAQLEEQVWAVSEGNPFVAVETTRALMDGAQLLESMRLPLPERVRAMIAGRLDRLSDAARFLAAVAAVIGREFEFRLLHRASALDEAPAAEGVEELVRRHVLRGVGERFEFTHERIRAVVYGGLLSPQRKLLHRRVGETLEALHAGNLEPHYLALGAHFREGEVWDKAVAHLRRAGARAVERSAYREAAACFERALATLAHLPESQSTIEQGFEIRLELRPMLSQLGEIRRVRERLGEAETLAEKLDDDRRRVRVSALATNAHLHLGELDDALATGTRALEIAGGLGDSRLRILATTSLAQVHLFRGDYERVVELATDNLAALAAESAYESLGTGLPEPIFNRYWLVRSLPELGRFDEAARYETEALRLAEATHRPYTVAMTHYAAGTLHLFKGDWAQARPLFEHAISLLRRENVLDLHATIASSAWVLAQVGEASEALTRLRESEELIERHVARGNLGFVWWTYYYLSRAALLLRRLNEARSLADRAVNYSQASPGFAGRALQFLGDIATHPDQFDAESGEAHYRQASALAEPRGMRPLVAHCHLGLGKLYRRTGEREQAREHLGIATTLYREMDMRFWLEPAEVEMKALE